MSKITIDYLHINGAEMFASAPYAHPDQTRVFGYKDSKRLGLALYPASPPMAYYVLDDIEVIFGDEAAWTDAAQAHRARVLEGRDAAAACKLPEGADFVTPPFAHQIEAISKAFWEHRAAIFHDMGLGKTKTLLDVLRLVLRAEPDTRILLLCPPHLLRNWERQGAVHARPGDFNAFVMVDAHNQAMSLSRRHAFYAGDATGKALAGTRFEARYPDLVYQPLGDGLPGEAYAAEDAYVEAIHAGDAKARTRCRAKLRALSQRLGFSLPEGNWRRQESPLPDIRTVNLLIASYDVAVADKELLLAHYPYNVIACDESHNLQSSASKRTKAVCALAQKARRRYLLSGTPSLGDPLHLYGQLQFLSPSLVEDYYRYTKRYLVKSRANPHMVVGFKNLHVLNMVVNDVAHRKKQEECIDLPACTFVEIEVPPSPELRHVYNNLVTNWTAELEDMREVQVFMAADRLNKLLQVLSGFYIDSNKLNALCDFCPHLMDCVETRTRPYTAGCHIEPKAPPKSVVHLKDPPRLEACRQLAQDILREPSNKLIIWCTYTEELNMVEAMLREEGVGYVRVDGGTKNKVACEDRFREDATCRVYLSHVSISEGLTLNAANYTLFYGLTYNLKHYEQALKRNHRIGQTRSVVVYHLVTPKSIHEFILRALKQKLDVAHTITDAVRCATCESHAFCAARNIRPFDPDCVYSPKKERVVTRPALI